MENKKSVENKGLGIKELYLNLYQVMYHTAYSILMDHYESEDVVHNAIIKLTQRIDSDSVIKTKGTKAYVVVMVRNLSIDVYNQRKRIDYINTEDMPDLPSSSTFNIDNKLLKKEEYSLLKKKISKLKSPYHEILILKYFNDFSLTEIACSLGITKNNASVRLYRALASLKNIYKI